MFSIICFISIEKTLYLFLVKFLRLKIFKCTLDKITLSLILSFYSLFRRHSFVQQEMAKYQLQASGKWSFDFIKEAPISCSNSQYKWKSSTIYEIPKFYHHISQSSRLEHHSSSTGDGHGQLFSECENICPLSQHISSPSMIVQHPLPSNKRKIVRAVSSVTVCSNQQKITGE